MKITNEVIDNVDVLRVAGRLDASAVRDHKDTLKNKAESVNNWLVLNMEGIDFIDSSGLGLVVSLVRHARENSADIAITNLTPQAQTLFELTRMTRIFNIYENESVAVEALKH